MGLLYRMETKVYSDVATEFLYVTYINLALPKFPKSRHIAALQTQNSAQMFNFSPKSAYFTTPSSLQNTIFPAANFYQKDERA
jgi:hypothetical protein